MPGPPHVERNMNWKAETALRRSAWPFVARRCRSELGELRCEHLSGHPGKCIAKKDRKAVEW